MEGRHCILFDDIVDSAGTICNAAQALIDAGATDVAAYASHGVLSGPAKERIANSVLKELVVTDSINIPEDIQALEKLRIVSAAPLLAEAVRRVAEETSVSSLEHDNGPFNLSSMTS